jgi:SAM-dependent methyltransferase
MAQEGRAGAGRAGRIHPHYGVFSPVRGEYVDLLASAPIPAGCDLAFDIGTGSGIIAAVLARRGVKQIVATDQDARALACAVENIERLGLAAQVTVIKADLFPEGKAPLVVCNPPWLPAEPTRRSNMPSMTRIRACCAASWLAWRRIWRRGRGWLVISDIAELLGLRSRQQLLAWIDAGSLQVLGRLDTRPKHPKAQDASDPLHAARPRKSPRWRLGKKKPA